MLGVYAGTSEKDSATLIDVVTEEFHKMTQRITPEELMRAKAQIKAGLLMGLESPSSRARRIAHTILTFDQYVTLEEVIKKIDQVTEKDVRQFAESLLNAPLSIASLGPIGNLPSFESIKSKLT